MKHTITFTTPGDGTVIVSLDQPGNDNYALLRDMVAHIVHDISFTEFPLHVELLIEKT